MLENTRRENTGSEKRRAIYEQDCKRYVMQFNFQRRQRRTFESKYYEQNANLGGPKARPLCIFYSSRTTFLT